ncbi:MAG: primosomal protein N' [Kiritimatiellae bacterium]|nr:primosomal protein N' [Kiritimatiellia bacterium]
MTIRVATEVVLDQLYDYAVPAELVSKMQPGLRVRVPLGARVVDGYVIEVLAEKGEALDELPLFSGKLAEQSEGRKFKLRYIHSITDDIPYVTANLLKLVTWMADYYCAPFEQSLRCILPAAVRSKSMRSKEQLYVAPQQGEFKLTKRQSELLVEINRVGGGWMRFLTREFSCAPQTIHNLAERGAVTIEPRQVWRDPLANRKILPTKPMELMPEQRVALDTISRLIDLSAQGQKTAPILLHGVTGSGKTEVYLQAIAQVLVQGRGAIVLVPEIALTPQTVQRFAARFGKRIAVLHSALSEGERFDEWHRIRSGAADVVIGPRSALFAPVKCPGLIVVDEEHEPSYKQDESPRYHARDVATVRGAMEGCVVVLGTATPSMESWNNAQSGKYNYTALTARVSNRPMPDVYIIDMRREAAAGQHATMFSAPLMEAIRLRLERGEQAILFLNRRGFANSLQCPECGDVAQCDACNLAYTYHQSDSCLRCHICGGWKHLPSTCGECGAPVLKYTGYGTQRVEIALKKCFPQARVLRMDADVTTRKSSHDELLTIFRTKQADILIGTQMIAKGLDFPNVTLVGVLNADISLHMPDIRASERTWQLLAQVSGRAGRADLPGEVYIQTYSPDHPAVRVAGGHESFETMATRELAERRAGGYPPFTHMVCLTFSGRSEQKTAHAAACYAAALKKITAAVKVSEAAPAPLAKARDRYRYQILMRSTSAIKMVNMLRKLMACQSPGEDVRMSVDVDVVNMM